MCQKYGKALAFRTMSDRKRSESALMQVVQEAFVNGVPKIVNAYLAGIVSKLVQER